MTINELKDEARLIGLEGFSKFNKQQLAEELTKKAGEIAADPTAGALNTQEKKRKRGRPPKLPSILKDNNESDKNSSYQFQPTAGDTTPADTGQLAFKSETTQTEKKRRGRKPGSKNKKTLEALLVAQKEQSEKEAEIEGEENISGEPDHSEEKLPIDLITEENSDKKEDDDNADEPTEEQNNNDLSEISEEKDEQGEEEQTEDDSDEDAREKEEGTRFRDRRYAKLRDNIDEAVEMSGKLTVRPEGFGFMAVSEASFGVEQVYVSASQIQKFRLVTGDEISGKVRSPKEGEAYPAMLFVEMVNGRLTKDIIEEERKRLSKPEEKDLSIYDTPQSGILEIIPEGFGFLRMENFLPSEHDVYVSPAFIRKYKLRTGDMLTGKLRMGFENDKYDALHYVELVNGAPPEDRVYRRDFERLVPIFPNEKIKMETHASAIAARMLDMFAPVGKGQRGLIVSPPKAGKTILLKTIAKAIEENYPEITLIILLVDERPEEVTDMKRSVNADVVYSTFDQKPANHVKAAEMVLERAKRLVECGQDVVVLVDSITRLARANNMVVAPSGRTLSGGLDPESLYFPKKFFGAARNIEGGGSLTILATTLIDTGSRMDDMIYEEFKGTGNMEVHLERQLAENRIFPAINISRSGTRREDLLLSDAEESASFAVRKTFANVGVEQFTDSVIQSIKKTKKNEDFVRLVLKNYLAETKRNTI